MGTGQLLAAIKLCLVCLAWPLTATAAVEAARSAAFDLHQKGQFQEAATQGLGDLLFEPWHHDLRFIVADSLQRIGQNDQAIMQFEALDGTAYADSATLRLNALRGDQPLHVALTHAPGRPLDVVQLEANALQYQYVVPEVVQSPVQSPVKTRERPVSTLRGKVVLGKPSQAFQPLHDLAAKGDYAAVATQGMALLTREKLDDQTHLLVANSLAWAGHLDDAVTQYQAVLQTQGGQLESQIARDASVGLGNVYRWRGHDEQAVPLYDAVLALDPKNAAALEGLNLAKRELRPRTLVTLGASGDSSDAKRRNISVNQRWRDASGKHIFEVEGAALSETVLAASARDRELTLRYQSLALPFQPKFELSGQGNPENKLFGSLQLYFGGVQNTLEIGRVNWGRLASNANALQAGLTANHLGVGATIEGEYGQLSGRFDYYGISDENTIIGSGIRYTPAWRPLGSHFKLFTGTETRDASQGAANNSYWSPVAGFGTLYGGLFGEWGGANWNLYGSGQIGFHLFGEAGTNWSLSAGGKRWLGDDYALGLSLFRLSSSRDNASYNAKAITMTLEKLWK
jgi:tetratricopeptide (TPR) repeat protein